MNPSQLIAYLNAIDVGEMDGIVAKLEEARQACLRLEEQELSLTLQEASEALADSDIKTYRRKVATAISRLGHLR